MRRPGPLLLSLLVILTGLSVSLGAPPAYAADPVHTLTVASTGGAAMYPAYSGNVGRYAITTTAGTAGAVTLNATTSDSSGRVLVNGRPHPSGPVTVSGLQPGDEVSVIFVDAGGREPHSLIYLPASFPKLEVTTSSPGALSGSIALTLSRWSGNTPNFETIVDRHGVPIYVYQTTTNGLDLKRQPNGQLSVSRSTAPGAPYRTVMLDDTFTPTGTSYGTVGLTGTDGHDSAVFSDGSRLLISYEPNGTTHKTDAVIQRIAPNGDLDWQWDSSDFLDESVVPTTNADYAHINSVQLVADDDVIASFRHLSSVYRIATKAHDGYAPGDVIWKLGGRDSTFDFVDEPAGYGGPCAQHTAYEVSPNHVLIFDNRTNGMCVDPSDPTGPTTNVGTTRLAEYALDTDDGTATLAWSYDPGNYESFFAGSAERLPGNHTLAGWAPATDAIATEVNAAGTKVWNLRQPTADGEGRKYFTYRAALVDLDDAEDPEATVTTPAEGATYAQGSSVNASYECTDRGGSMLADCSGPKAPGTPLDTGTLGAHTFAVTAHDGAGNDVVVQRHYTVAAPPPPPPPPAARYRPDVMSRGTTTSPWTGANTYGGTQNTTRTIPRKGHAITAWFAVQNDGNRTDTMSVLGAGSTSFFSVKYYRGTRDVTGAVTRGVWRTRLAAGKSVTLKTVVTRTARATVGKTRQFGLRAVSVTAGNADRATVTVRATTG